MYLCFSKLDILEHQNEWERQWVSVTSPHAHTFTGFCTFNILTEGTFVPTDGLTLTPHNHAKSQVWIKVHSCVVQSVKKLSESCPAMSNSWWPHGLQPAGLLCPWDSPGKNTGWAARPPPGGLPDPEIKPVSLKCLALAMCSLPLAPPGKPFIIIVQSQRTKWLKFCNCAFIFFVKY